MRDLRAYFENRVVDYNKLLEYGFKDINGIYMYEKTICDAFFVSIKITKKIKTAKVIDILANEEYVLVDVVDASGEFVGKVRKEYEDIIKDVINKCTTRDIFKSKEAKKIIKYVKEKYNDDLEYLWEKFPSNAVWRNKRNNKWYGALLIVDENKLGINSDQKIEIIDLRYQKDKIKDIIDNKKIYSGYHMNKDNWITIKLDESVDIKEIYDLIDNSYNLSLGK